VTAPSDRKKKTLGRLPLILLGVFAAACLVALLFLGDLARYQETGMVAESRAVLRDVDDPARLDEALRRYPANRILKLIAQAGDKSGEIEATSRSMLEEAVPAALAKPVGLTGANRGDLEALRRDLQIAESNLAALAPRLDTLIKAKHGELQAAARSLGVDSATIARLMVTVDELNAELTAGLSQAIAARREYHAAHEKCVALLLKEFGTYKVTNGQFIFRLQPAADSYNAASGTMSAAAKRMSESQDAAATWRRLQLDRWRKFVGDL